MSNQELFGVLNDMLYELKDGHVNLTSEENQSHFDFWTDSPVNFNESIIENTHYLGRNYRQIAGLKYRILSDNIGYIYYETFADGIGNSNLDVVFSYLADCKALIFDVRQNSGGNATNSTQIASRFTNEKILTGYIQHKTGPGHHDFSRPYAIYLNHPKTSVGKASRALPTGIHIVLPTTCETHEMSAQCSNCRRQDRGGSCFFIGVTQRMDSPLFFLQVSFRPGHEPDRMGHQPG